MNFKRFNKMFICIVALFSLGMSPVPNKIVVKAAGKIPIQYNGRIKSLDIFARETMQVLTGKQSWRKGPAVVFLLDVLSGKENLQRPLASVSIIKN